jgi:hypothetical protein
MNLSDIVLATVAYVLRHIPCKSRMAREKNLSDSLPRDKTWPLIYVRNRVTDDAPSLEVTSASGCANPTPRAPLLSIVLERIRPIGETTGYESAKRPPLTTAYMYLRRLSHLVARLGRSAQNTAERSERAIEHRDIHG